MRILDVIRHAWRRRGLPADVRSRRARFDREVRANRKRMEEVSLAIVIFGQGPLRDTPMSRKRLEIRLALAKQSHLAVLPEDEPLSAPDDLDDPALPIRELEQVRASDLAVVLLEGSLGAVGEVHDFGTRREIAPKMFVLAPSAYKDGYTGVGLLNLLEAAHGNVCWYEPGDIERCRVKEMVLRRVRALQQLRYYDKR